MRTLIAVVVALLVAVVLVLWFTHGSTTTPIAPNTAPAPAPHVDAHTDALTPAAQLESSTRVAKPTDPAATTDAGPRCHVFGRVIDERQAPLADVSISLYPVGGRWSDTDTIAKVGEPGHEHESLRTKTGSDGRFTFDAPVPTADWIELDIQPDPYHANVRRDFGPAGGRNKPRLVAGDNDLGDFALGLCGAIAGRVMSPDGTALQSAWVSSFDPEAEGRGATAKSDEQGRFVLGHLPPGARKMDVQCEGFVTRHDMPIEVRVSVTTPIEDIVLARAFVISGTVLDDEGKTVPHIYVYGSQVEGSRTSARTTDDGTFHLYLEKNAPCTFEVTRAKGFDPWGGGPDARFDAGATDVRIVLHRSPGFTFKVIDARTHEPIERFGIRLDPKPVVGSYSTAVERDIPLEDHPGGEVRLPMSDAWVVTCAPGHATLETDLVADAGTKDTQTLALHLGSSVKGRVLLSGAPLANATITLMREIIDKDRKFNIEPGVTTGGVTYDVAAFTGRKRTRGSDAQGAFVMDDLAPGTWMLQIDAPGAARKRFRGLVVPEENLVDLGDIALDPGATIRGVLVAAAGESPEGFVVRLDSSLRNRNHSFGSGKSVEIDNIDGKFEFTGLVAGTHDISWARATQHSWSGDDPREQSIELAAGETRDIVLDASASVPCKVIVHLTRAGKPAAGIGVSALYRSRVTPTNYRMNTLGTSGSDGTVQGEVDGDATFDLEATSSDGNDLGDLAKALVAVPGGSIERTCELSVGRLVVELPKDLAIPASGVVHVTLSTPEHGAFVVSAPTIGAPQDYRGGSSWEDARIDFGELASGTYEATVAVQRFEADPAQPKFQKAVDLRAPYKTKVTIEADHEAKIVVP